MLSIKGTPWSPDGERAGDVSIRVDLPEARGDRGVHPRILTDQSSPVERCSRGLVSPPDAWVAVPFEQELGTCQTTLSDVSERIEQELGKEPEGASRVARDRERIKRARHEERARDMKSCAP